MFDVELMGVNKVTFLLYKVPANVKLCFF